MMSERSVTMAVVYCPDEAATEALGRRLGRLCRDGDVFLLNGDLGTGKTCLVTAAATAMGVDPKEVTSPTFSLMNVYHGKELNIKHFDLYRINWPAELEDIGFSEYAGGDGVTFIEWAELFPDTMPEENLELKFSRKGEGREVEFLPHGKRYEALAAALLKESGQEG